MWTARGLAAVAHAEITTVHPRPGWAEQDPDAWWRSCLDAAAAVRDRAGAMWHDVGAVAFSAARETFAPVDAALVPLGPGIVWSDRRAEAEATALLARHGGRAAFHRRTGLLVDAGAVLAKVAWLEANESDRLAVARWLLSPRDLVYAHMTGQVRTDRTLASRTGAYGLDGRPLDGAMARGDLLPPVVPSTEAAPMLGSVASTLGLRAGIPVVIGAGDRACEVLGTGATPSAPMVSWGTTAAVALPSASVPQPLPDVFVVSAGALGGHVLEAGLSAAGQAIAWLGALTGSSTAQLMALAHSSPAGARGVVALPYLNGARAPWWRSSARAGFAGLTPAHGIGDLARAIVEAVAVDATLALRTLGTALDEVHAAGGGAAARVWLDVLAAVTGAPAVRRATTEAGSVGAALVASHALGLGWGLDTLAPVDRRVEPGADTPTYAALVDTRAALVPAVLDALS